MKLLRRLAAVPASVLGMLTAHYFAYRIVTPDSHHRHQLLETTGHAWGALTPMIAGIAVLALVVGSWQRAGSTRGPVRLTTILGWQTVVYATVEIVERAVSGSSIWPGAALLVAGAFCQLPVALFIWAVLRYVVDPIVAKLRRNIELDTTTAHLGFLPVVTAFISAPSRLNAGRAPPLIA